MKRVQVLVTTMHQTGFDKYREMNLQTDAIIANQADTCAFLEEEIDGNRVRFVTTPTRGLSMNRNIAIVYSDADIVLFSDDDQVFVDGYEKIVSDEFDRHPDAVAIKFFTQSTNPQRPLSYQRVDAFKKATKRNSMSAGVHCLAIKREFLLQNNLFFDVRIGAGTKLYCGEDSVFINYLLKHGAKLYHSPELLGYVTQEDSTWFQGYTEQYFLSCGYIYGRIYGVLAPLACARRAYKLKNRVDCDWRFWKMFGRMIHGVKLARGVK